MLPVLVLMLFGVGYVCRLFCQTLTANDRARLCVQLYAQMSCEKEEKLPDYCHEVFNEASEAPPANADARAALDDAQADLNDARRNKGVADTEARSNLLTKILDGLFGEGETATVNMSAKRPGVLGGGETSISVGSYALCNTKPVVADDLAEALFNSF